MSSEVTLSRTIAHRGASGRAPENTLAALRAAAAAGARWVECDVLLSQDDAVFVCHDDTLNRTTNGRGKVHRHTAAALAQLDAGSAFSPAFAGEPIPTLRAWLDTARELNMQVNIELKGRYHYATLVEKTVAELARYCAAGGLPYLVSSFHLPSLSLFQQLAPAQPFSINLAGWPWRMPRLAFDPNCYSWHLNIDAVTAKRVSYTHQHQKRLVAYNVSSAAEIKQLFALGVDGVFVDDMALLQDVGAN